MFPTTRDTGIYMTLLRKQGFLRRWSALGMALVCAAALLANEPGAAQFLDQGAITGTVQDNTGAAVPGASVSISDPATGFKLTTIADKSGVYSFSPIKIGTYTVTASAPNFSTSVQKNIPVTTGSRVNYSPKLQLGEVTASVTVTDAPPLLQSQQSVVGQVLSTQEINDTPLNGRNVVYLAQLTAGVAPSKGSRGNGTGDFDANGMRAEQNNFLLDGMDNNAVTPDYLGGTSYVINPAPDALQEFTVETANFNAEFGHSAGAVVIESIKSGTNNFHGDLWEYNRNSYLNAHDWTALPTTPNPKYIENEFGASLGGPVLRNRIFLFGDLQANRIAYDQPENVITVPTVAERTGDFSELLNPANTSNGLATTLYVPHNNQTILTCPARAATAAYTSPTAAPGTNILCPTAPTYAIDTVATNILNLYPLPNTGAPHQTYNNYLQTLAQPQDTFQWDVRSDYNISAKDQMFARFSYINARANFAAPLGPILDGGGANQSLNQSGAVADLGNNFVVSETHIFSPRLVNQFRFGYVYAKFNILNPGFNTNDAAALGLGGVPSGPGFPLNGGLPTTTVGGIASFGSHAYRPEVEYANEYQILDNFTMNLGNHAVSLGFSYQSIRSDVLEPPASHPAYSFGGVVTSKAGVSNTGSGVADFLTDNMTGGSIGPSGTFNDDQNNIAGYLQDDWKATKTLTLNIGVRYEYFQPYTEMSGRQANFFTTSVGVGTGTGVYLLPAEDQGKLAINPAFLTLLAKDGISVQYDQNPQLTQAQHLNFAPRVGFAYSMDPTTVIRGGYGIFFQGQQQAGAADNIATNYPFVFSDNFPATACTTGSTNCQNNGYTLETGFSSLIAQGLTSAFATPGLVGQSPNIKTTYAQDFNMTFEHSFTPSLVATIGYVGTNSRHLPIGINTNSTLALLPSGTTQQFLPFPDFTGSVDVLYEGISSYNGLQTKLQKRISHGLQFLATYTWSHSLDDAANPLGGGIGGYRDASIIPIREDLTNSGWDVRHRFTFNGFYQLPVGRGQKFLGHTNAFLDALFGGYSTNVTFQAQTGNPFSVGITRPTGVNNDVGGSQYAIRTGNPNSTAGGTSNSTLSSYACPTAVRNKTHWYNPCAYSNPLPASLITPFKPNTPAGTRPVSICPDPTIACMPNLYPYPTYISDEATAKLFLGGVSDTTYGPGYTRMDASVFKHFHTFREEYLELRADVFNLLNTPEYGQPGTSNDSVNGGLITSAHMLQNATPNSRFFQLSGKYVF
jgi:hypothetical protein